MRRETLTGLSSALLVVVVSLAAGLGADDVMLETSGWRRPPSVGLRSGGVAGGASVAAPSDKVHTTPSGKVRLGKVPLLKETAVIHFGVVNDGGPALDEVERVGQEVGASPTAVLWYEAFTVPDFPTRDAQRLADRGIMPVVTWEPWDPARGVEQPQYRLSEIARGAFDDYLRRWAREIAAWGRPLMLRFAHEMNGDWYPWCEQANGNSPGSYIAAWKHLHDVFGAAGAKNVTWVWSPNVAHVGSQPLQELYPGSDYVDWVALDGYNWGAARPDSTWQSFHAVFGDSLAEIRQIAGKKPLAIAEIASSEIGGDKARWVGDFLTRLPTLTAGLDLRAFFWFNLDKETDWRIASSEASLRTFGQGLHTLRLGGQLVPSRVGQR